MRTRIYHILERAQPGDVLSRLFDQFIVALILLNLAAFIVGTVEPLYLQYQTFFDGFEFASLAIFTVEYAARLWACGVNPAYKGVGGAIRFARRPLMVIDLLAILPGLLPFIGVDLRILRSFRVIRLLRVLKLARYSRSLQMLGRVLRNKRDDLITAFGLIFLMILLAATALYYAERGAQPDLFGSIPHAMWWAVATLTTVGYGDVYPITPIGKVCGAVVALLGITLFAVPTGILASAFQDESARAKASGDHSTRMP